MKKPSTSTPSKTPDPNIDDPRPEAAESKPVRKDGGDNDDDLKRKKAIHPALMPRGDPSSAA